MKKQLTEARLQFLAGVINENEFRQLAENSSPIFQIGDIVTYNVPSVDDITFKVAAIVPNYESIPKDEIGYYDIDPDAYEDGEMDEPWYKNPSGDFEGWYAQSELAKVE